MKRIFLIMIAAITVASVSAQSYRGDKREKSVEEKLNDLYCTGMFHSAEGTILDVANNASSKGYINVLNWLEARVSGLQIFMSRTGVPIPVIRGSVPGIYIDEIPVSMSSVSSLSMNDISIVKVIKSPFLGGFNSGGGAIAIYTIGSEEEEEE